MAQKKMTIADIKGLVTAYFTNKKIADPSWTPSKESISGLVEKIMKEVVIAQNFNDKLPELDGDILPFGEAIEEYFTGLVPAEAYNDNESNAASAEAALKPYRPTFDQVCYSERLGRKKFKTTVDYNKYEVAFNNAGDLGTLINLVTKRLYDSLAVWRYGVKKGLIGKLADKAIAENAGNAYTTNSTVIKAGVIYVQSNKYYIAKKNFAAAVNKTLADLAGNDASYPYSVIEITPSMVKTISAVTDTDTSEAFIQAIKEACEDAQFNSNGNCLSGSAIGAEEGLVLYVKKGVIPTVQVQALAGAFHAEELNMPVSIKVIDDFGGASNEAKLVAVLVDPRGIKLHNNYRAVREDLNGDGDYVNYTLHNEDTGFLSAHTFVRVFKTA